MPVSAIEWAASAHIEALPVNRPATIFAIAMAAFAATATITVQVLSPWSGVFLVRTPPAWSTRDWSTSTVARYPGCRSRTPGTVCHIHRVASGPALFPTGGPL
ncbi:hypothetical protein GCM10023107_65200 [Actinoplanes octamycinicus]|nr:hypothetical protein Aoc01nite_15730 [Actinoplanes octamycinicus]